MDYKFNKKKDKKKDEEPAKLDLSKLMGIGGFNQGIETKNNHIYFYDDVTTDSCLELNQEIQKLNISLQKYSLDYNCPPPKIYLHINSYGGDLLAVFSTVDYIRNSKIPIVSIIEGCAASAATLMSVVADERYMTPSSYMLIHQLRSGYWGKYDELEEDMDNNKKFMERIYEIYEENTHLTRKELKRMLKKDEWWDLKTCLDYGLVDGTNENIFDFVVNKKRTRRVIRSDDDDKEEGNKKEKGCVVMGVETRSKKSKK